MDAIPLYRADPPESTSYREKLARTLLTMLRIAAAFVFITFACDIIGLPIGYDDTDGKNVRSGLGLYTDFGTGCQYLWRFGGLTPRMSGSGTQMGCRP